MSTLRNMLLAIAACLLAGIAQAVSLDSVTFTKNHELVLAEYPNSPLDLKPFSNASSINEVKIISHKTYKIDSGSYAYLVLAITGWTTSGKGSGQCGAGTETNMVWLKISGSYISGSQSFLANSCAASIDGGIPEKGSFTKSYYAAAEDREYMVGYDENRPMDGLQITSKEKTL